MTLPQVSPYVDRVRTSRGQQLNYRRLSVIADAWPKDLPSNYAMLLQSPQSIAAFKEAVTDAVLKTPEDSKVLLVVPAKLQQHAEAALKCPTLDFLDRGLDVRITHFKVDIGSNDYADCTDVILFGLHHAPKTAHLQRGLQFSQMRVSQEMLDDQQGSLTGFFQAIRADDYKAQIKQLGARGRVRVASPDGTCGKMRLWTYQGEVSPQEIKALFPGARMEIASGAFRRRHGVRHDRKDLAESVVSGLQSLCPGTDEITLKDLGRLIDLPDLPTRGTRLSQRSDTWSAVGWSFVPGQRGRGGCPAKFVRSVDERAVA